jgi:hypothetical protein
MYMKTGRGLRMSLLIGFARAYDVQNYFVASRDLH